MRFITFIAVVALSVSAYADHNAQGAVGGFQQYLYAAEGNQNDLDSLIIIVSAGVVRFTTPANAK